MASICHSSTGTDDFIVVMETENTTAEKTLDGSERMFERYFPLRRKSCAHKCTILIVYNMICVMCTLLGKIYQIQKRCEAD